MLHASFRLSEGTETNVSGPDMLMDVRKVRSRENYLIKEQHSSGVMVVKSALLPIRVAGCGG